MSCVLIPHFARRVLFGTALADKLDPPRPEECAEAGEGAAVSANQNPDRNPTWPRTGSFGPLPVRGLEPGRPEAWRFKSRGERSAKLPAGAALIDDASRARLLHFFCNHELLAVELMALALLKFPDAPPAFAREVLATLLEEQQHTRWYLQRMADLGLELGSQPLSRMIWDAIAPMDSPLDYVSRLSLTFEQANLDYALFYHRQFKDAGDPDSAAILGRIYRDEIGHVQTGVRWLRLLKDPQQSDLAAWSGQLRHPLSALRARGNVPLFNAEGRARAGLDPAWIDAVRVAGGPRGRDPDRWHFDALADLRWGGAPVPARLEALNAELDGVLCCLAASDDQVCLAHPPSEVDRQRWAEAGLSLPVVIPATTGEPTTIGKTAAELEAESKAASNSESESKSPAEPAPPVRRELHWAPDPARDPAAWAALFDKAHAAAWLADFRAQRGLRPDPQLELELLTDLPALARRVNAHFAESGQPLVLKARFGASGQGVRRLDRAADLDRHARWLAGHLAESPKEPVDLADLSRPGGLLLGRWLPVVQEGSVHFQVENSGVARGRGAIWTESGRGGRFAAAVAAPRPFADRLLSPALRRFLHQGAEWTPTAAEPSQNPPESGQPSPEPTPRQWFAELLPALLASRCQELGYHGPIGIDFLIFRRENGELGLHPLNDLNPRHTFGRAALELQRRAGGRWTLRIGNHQDEAAARARPGFLPLSFGPATTRRLWAERSG